MDQIVGEPMNLPTALLLFLAALIFIPTGLAMLLVAGITVADEVRLRLWHRRSMRHVDELLRGER